MKAKDGGWSDVPSAFPVRPPSRLVARGDGPSSVARTDARFIPLEVFFRRFSGVFGAVGPLFSHPFSLRRERDRRTCGTAPADHPPEPSALGHSGRLGSVVAPLPFFSGSGVYRVGNGLFRGKGDAVLAPKKESPFSGIGLVHRGRRGRGHLFPLRSVRTPSRRSTSSLNAGGCTRLGATIEAP